MGAISGSHRYKASQDGFDLCYLLLVQGMTTANVEFTNSGYLPITYSYKDTSGTTIGPTSVSPGSSVRADLVTEHKFTFTFAAGGEKRTAT